MAIFWNWKPVIIVAVGLCYVLLTSLDKHWKCSWSPTVNQLCSAYEAGEVTGPLCPDLCKHHNIHFEKCLTTVPEKNVFIGKWQGREVVLKVIDSWFHSFEFFKEEDDHTVLSTYQLYVQSRVKDYFGECSKCSQLATKLESLGDGNSDGSVSASEARSFLALLYQPEPMMLMVLNGSKHSLDYFGHCGGMYAVEKVAYIAEDVFGAHWNFVDLDGLPDVFEPLENMFKKFVKKILDLVFSIPYISTILDDGIHRMKSFIHSLLFQVWVPSYAEKFAFAYSMLDAILELSSNPYGLAQFCDGHLGNFGVTNNSVVKLVDLDTIYPDFLLKSLLQKKECVSDEDCWEGNHEDCVSTCDANTATCTPYIQKQDLHNVCLHFHLIFQSNSELNESNTTRLKKAIKRLTKSCKYLPVANSLQELRRNTLFVKEQLQSIEVNCTQKLANC